MHVPHVPPAVAKQPTIAKIAAGPAESDIAPHVADTVVQNFPTHVNIQAVYATPGAVTAVNCVDIMRITNNQSIWNVFILSLSEKLVGVFLFLKKIIHY